MIKLDVQPYCQECPAFDPVKHMVTEKYVPDMFGDPVEVNATHIRCRDWKRCKQIERYLRKELEHESNDEDR